MTLSIFYLIERFGLPSINLNDGGSLDLVGIHRHLVLCDLRMAFDRGEVTLANRLLCLLPISSISERKG